MPNEIEAANPPTLQPAAGDRRPVSGSEPWVIYAKVHSRGEVYWWRPESKGYTRNLECAGHYTEAEARSIEKGCEHEHVAIRLSDLMPLQFQRVLDLGYGHNGETFNRILAQRQIQRPAAITPSISTEREPQVCCDAWLGELECALRSQKYLTQRMRAGGASFVATHMEYTLRCLEMEIEDRRRSPSEKTVQPRERK